MRTVNAVSRAMKRLRKVCDDVLVPKMSILALAMHGSRSCVHTFVNIASWHTLCVCVNTCLTENVRAFLVQDTHGHLPELVEIMIEAKIKLFVSAVGTPPKWLVDKMHAAGIPVRLPRRTIMTIIVWSQDLLRSHRGVSLWPT